MRLCERLQEAIGDKYIFDYVDPASGLLMRSDNHNHCYFEKAGIDHFLKHYKSVQIGMCRVVDHPEFGINSSPATIFTDCPDIGDLIN